MNILQVLLCLVGLGIITLILGTIIVRHDSQRKEFWEDVAFMRELINSSEVSKTAYQNCLEAFREFDSIAFRDDKAYKKLFADFLFKYRDFLPPSDKAKIKTIPE
jgi:hypothetical protein